MTTHGDFGTPFYFVWNAMKQRCNNPNTEKYPRYGGRGITYCAKWENYIGFKEDMAESWLPGLSLDRLDVNGDYTKENCRWITVNKNSRRDKLKAVSKYTLQGEFIISYNSAKQAEGMEGNITRSMIGILCKNHKPSKGFRWAYGNSKADLPKEFLVQSNYSNRQGKAILQIDCEGRVVNEFIAATIASKELSIPVSGIRNACKTGNIYKEFTWKYKSVSPDVN